MEEIAQKYREAFGCSTKWYHKALLSWINEPVNLSHISKLIWYTMCVRYFYHTPQVYSYLIIGLGDPKTTLGCCVIRLWHVWHLQCVHEGHHYLHYYGTPLQNNWSGMSQNVWKNLKFTDIESPKGDVLLMFQATHIKLEPKDCILPVKSLDFQVTPQLFSAVSISHKVR